MNAVKYPRTPHLPWSEGATSDDKTLVNIDHFFGCECVITEKLDGESASVYPDGSFHARSLNWKYHPSQSKMRQFASSLGGDDIWKFYPKMRLMGENTSATHTVSYKNLPHFFFLFGVGYEGMTTYYTRGVDNDYEPTEGVIDIMASWDSVCEVAALLLVPTPQILWRGILSEKNHKGVFDLARKTPSPYCDTPEGYVIRKTDAFNIEDFGKNVAKFVGKKFKENFDEDQHWKTKAVVWNHIEGE